MHNLATKPRNVFSKKVDTVPISKGWVKLPTPEQYSLTIVVETGVPWEWSVMYNRIGIDP